MVFTKTYTTVDHSVSALIRPADLSDGAWSIIKSVYSNYLTNDSKEFEEFSQFNFSSDELLKYCKELHSNRYVFLEYDSDNQMYLYMLPKILYCFKDYSSDS